MKTIHALSAVFLMLLLSSCTGLSTQDIHDIKQPPKPDSVASDYSKALDKFSAMLTTYDLPETQVVLLGKTVHNKTACANLPMDITQMVATAVNRLGGKIRFAPYDPVYLEHEAIFLSQFGVPMGRELPALVIDGAITECDENLDALEMGVDGDAVGTHHGQEGEVSGGANKTSNISRITLDFHLMEYSSSLLLPRIQSSLAIDIKTIEGGYDFAIQVLGSGFGLNRSRKITQGKHEAIRAVVDMSMLQVLGKFLQVPYWRCLEDATPDNEVIRVLEETFARVPRENGIAVIQNLLQKHGYTSVQSSGVLDAATRNAINDIASKSNNQAPAQVSPSLYSYLYINLPLDFSIIEHYSGNTYGQPQGLATLPEQEKPQSPSLSKTGTTQFTFNLHTAVIYRPGKMGEVVLLSGDILKSGDHYKVVVEPEQDCFLYVFQKDSAGRLFLLFPRNDRSDGLNNPVRGNRTYEFPGDDKYFFLDQRKGDEQIYFYSAGKEDQFIENIVSQLSENITDPLKQSLEKKLLQYLSTKDTVNASGPGKQLALKQENGLQTIQMSRVQKLSKDTLYVFPFKHQ
jgi:hypothetical protein